MARARKDLTQAELLLELLAEEGRRDLERAATELRRRPRAAARARTQAKRLSPELGAAVLTLLQR
ncbi:hypothetical protein D3C83_196530 [compost metagenome]